MMGIQGLYKTKKIGVAVIIYYQFMMPQSLVLCNYVVKSPVLGLQRAPENSEFAPSVQFSLTKLKFSCPYFVKLKLLFHSYKFLIKKNNVSAMKSKD